MGFVRSRLNALAAFLTLYGLVCRAKPSVTSGRELVFETSDGVPHAAASIGDKPNPSYKERKINNVAPEYKAGISFSGSMSVSITLS